MIVFSVSRIFFLEKWLGRIFTHWDTNGVESLIKILLEKIEPHTYYGKTISLYVTATNNGDDLLWQFIAGQVTSENARRWQIRDVLQCQEHDFHSKEFFGERLIKSEELLNLVISSLETWIEHGSSDSSNNGQEKIIDDRLDNIYLNATSWEKTHSRGGFTNKDGLHELFKALEKAFIYHAMNNSVWWQKNESRLQEMREISIHYLLNRAFLASPANNASYIVQQLTDHRLLKDSRFNFELAELLNRVAAILSEKDLEQIQNTIINLKSYYKKQFEPKNGS